jgi:hypothetical protein
MSVLTLEDQIHRAPNGRFYAVWQGRAICAPVESLRYFTTEREARAFLARLQAESEFMNLGDFDT